MVNLLVEPDPSLTVNYSFTPTLFGKILIASANNGICYCAFVTDEHDALSQMKEKLRAAGYLNEWDHTQENAVKVFDGTNAVPVKLTVRGTTFQLKVWQQLLKIPKGRSASYGSIAEQLDQPSAARAVGSAVGSNPVAYLIPCHRVLRADGKVGGYLWGIEKKLEILRHESDVPSLQFV
jgi:AraC family transcriptional regulator, regulatory protein of adaptative response / methylated-DNA-[protein]-cysteine methyltransferase